MNVKSLIAFMLAAAATHADTLQHADLAKLSDPAQRDAEVARLADCNQDKRVLTGYHFLTAKQKDGNPPLHLLCAASDYRSQRDISIFGGYKIENPEQLFGNIASPVVFQLEPSHSKLLRR